MITVRKATKEDIDALTVLFDLYRIHYHQPSDIAAGKNFYCKEWKKKNLLSL